MHSRFFALLALCAGSLTDAPVLAQDNNKKIALTNAAPTTASPVEVRFNDGGYLRMGLLEDYLDLITPHGRLRIAVGELRRIELATRIPDATLRQIDQAIIGLGNTEFRVREKATADLL